MFIDPIPISRYMVLQSLPNVERTHQLSMPWVMGQVTYDPAMLSAPRWHPGGVAPWWNNS